MKDWKENWLATDIIDLAKWVGGKGIVDESVSTGGDDNLLIISSHQDPGNIFQELWDAGEYHFMDKSWKGKTWAIIKRNIAKHAEAEEMREQLCDTANDHWSGGDLERYQARVKKMSEAAVRKEYRKCFDSDKLLDLE